MISVLRSSWALLLGMLLLMLGNGMQSTLLGVRGGLEAFSPNTMGFVMAGYFAGFLGGALLAPRLVRRVGHVRVFAALGSLTSAAFIIYPTVVDPVAWTVMRVLVGFCYSGVYVVAESWLNDSATNETRGRALSAYQIVMMIGVIAAQALINTADPAGYTLFVMMSVAVSLSFLPMLLSAGPAPAFTTSRPMSFRALYRTSPLGVIGSLLLGAIFACQFGMSAVFASAMGLGTGQVSIFVGAIFAGGLILQYPIGWFSDRMDRRNLIAAVTGIGAACCLGGLVFADTFEALVISAFLFGGTANPTYSLLIAYTNDFLAHEDMASASGGLILLNGVGAAGTPILVGYLMQSLGPEAFLGFVAAALGLITVYALYRMTVRETPDEISPIAPYSMVSGTRVSAQIAQEAYAGQAPEAGPPAGQRPG